MLSNAYFLAKFRFDAAENEPAKILQNFRKMHFRKMHFRKKQLGLPPPAKTKADEKGGAGRMFRGRTPETCIFATDGRIFEKSTQFYIGRYSFAKKTQIAGLLNFGEGCVLEV